MAVLVQLLQSDEPEEVAVIKMVLIQHLELDSKVTLGILCDQIRPEALVVAFLAQDPRKPLLAQLQGQRRGAAEQEDALIYPHQGSIQILRGRRGEDHRVHSRLPALVQRGNDLVLLLLTRAAEAPREDLAPGRNPPSLEQSRGSLELSDLLCHAKGAADLAQLLRFYCTSSLMRKMTLGRLPQDSRAFFIARLASALAACSHRKSPESSELVSMRRQVVDALTIIPPFFIQVAPSDAQAWGSGEILLHTCQQRKEQQTNWTIPVPLVSVLSEISHLADEQESPESKRVADLSRALARHPLLAKPPPSPPSPPPNTKEFVDAPPPSRRKAGGQEPGLPQEQNGTQKLSIRGQHVHQRRHPKDITSSSSPQQSMCLGASTPVEAADDGDRRQQSSTTTTTKRLKVADEDKPSLSLRMGHQRRPPVGGRGRQGLKSKSPPTRQQQQRSDLPTPAKIPDVSVGISIMGAACSRSHPHSLLERIRGEGT
ncbi:hypothetical protein EDB84DRAFT_1615141 [Lactarius hengduanensis]|nr:hypothetical protein EDB84DRAFT_1615141 [Lactarius hengduanensis]